METQNLDIMCFLKKENNMQKTALILAAGLGSRFGILTHAMPKGFLKICGKSLIEMSINNLIKHEYEKIYIVTGHESDYYEKLAKKYDIVSTIHNSYYAESGSGYSMFIGLQEIKGGCTIIESDLLYDPNMLNSLEPNKDIIIASYITKSGDEVYIESCGNCMSNLSKNTSDLSNYLNEFVGITQISNETVNNVLLPFMYNLSNDNKRIEYEQILVKATKEYGVRFELKKTDEVWCEIDDIAQYYKAVNRIFPLLYNIS